MQHLFSMFTDLQENNVSWQVNLKVSLSPLPHAERALQVIGVQQVPRDTSTGFSFGSLFFGALCHTLNQPEK